MRSSFIVALSLALHPTFVQATPASERPRILVLYSGSPDPVLPTAFEDIMHPEIEKYLGSRIEVESEYLRLDSFSEERYRQQEAGLLANRYGGRNINLIVAVDFSSLTFAKKRIVDFLPNVPVVFVAVEERRLQDISLPLNFVGVTHHDDWDGALKAILQMLPKTRDVVVIAGSSPSEKRTLNFLEADLAPYRRRVKLTFLTSLTIAEMVRKVSLLPRGTVILQTGFVSDSRGEILPDNGGPKLMDKSASVPVFGLVGRNLGDGLLGGPMPAYRERYVMAAKIAGQILKGANPARIGIQSAKPEHPMAFDWRQLKRWNIEERRLPANSLVGFRQASAWQNHKSLIASLVLLFSLESALIAALLMQRARRIRTESDLKKSHTVVRSLAAKLIGAQEEERKRIARELHDDINQTVASIAILVSSLKRRESIASKNLASFVEIQARLNALAAAIRRMSHDLHPSGLELVGLSSALSKLIDDFRNRTGIIVHLNNGLQGSKIDPIRALCLYRIAQESLRNVEKHAGARHVNVQITQAAQKLRLTIRDDGRGFEPASPTINDGLGLTSIRERATTLGGEIEVRSCTGGGTMVTVMIPEQNEQTVST